MEHAALEIIAFISIPYGYTATDVIIYGSDATTTIAVKESDINQMGIGALGTGVIGTSINITDTAYTSTNFLAILIATQSSTEKVFGGAVTIAKN